MRRSHVSVAILLALVTGLLLSETGRLLLSPAIALDDDVHARANTAVINRFYDAVNNSIATGDIESLSDIVDADLIDHSPRPGASPDREGFLRSMELLHASDPTLRLVVLDMVAQGDRVMARINAVGGDEMKFLGLPAMVERKWSPVNVFRIERDMIVEHWSEVDGLATFESLLSVAAPVQRPSRRIVSLERWTYAPAAGETLATDRGLLVLLVDAGTLTIDLDARFLSPGQVVRRGFDQVTSDESNVPGSTVTLQQGDALVVPERRIFAVRNVENEPAVALVITTAAQDPTIAGKVADERWAAAEVGRVLLAGGLVVDLPDGSATIAIGRAALAAGATLPPHQVGAAELVAVEAGALALTAEGGDAWVTTDPDSGTRNAEDVTLTTGGGALFEIGTEVTFRSAGIDPLELVMVTIDAVSSK